VALTVPFQVARFQAPVQMPPLFHALGFWNHPEPRKTLQALNLRVTVYADGHEPPGK
jgi:hypothetical protein